MSKRILIIQGHPDALHERFCHALAERYATGARQAGHEVDMVQVARIEFPLLRSKEEWGEGTPPPDIQDAQRRIGEADHVLIVYPLWLGAMPALLKAFFEQVFRPGFAFDAGGAQMWKKKLTGKSARVMVTMGMPGFAYRWFFLAHSLKSLKRNILKFVGFDPVKTSVVGNIEGMTPERREAWLTIAEGLGADAD